MRARHPAVPAVFALLFVLACGRSPDAPPGGVAPALKIVLGGVSDTILATPRFPLDALVVQVWGLTGEPERDAGVVFDASVSGCPDYPYYYYHDCSRILLRSPIDGTFASRVMALTDAEGRAAVRLRMGPVAGPAFVRITVQGYGLADSAAFTVLPGAAFAVRRLTPDTTLDLDGTFAARGGVVDWPGNLLSDPVTFEATSPAVQVSAAGTVSARAIGRGYVRVHAAVGGATVTDSSSVTVVPKARLVISLGGRLKLSSLAGGDARVLGRSLYDGQADGAVWSPTGGQIVYATRTEPGGLVTSDTLGSMTLLTSLGVRFPMAPEYSRDGLWIYFHGANAGGVTQVFRVHPDGSGVEALQPPTDEGRFPSPSPDGTRFAYASGSDRLVVKTIATGHADTLATPGFTWVCCIRWSPDGNWIAFVQTYDGSSIGLIRPDGSGLRNLGGWGGVLSWSPDSKWLVTGGLTLVDVTAGTFYRLTTPAFSAAWQP